MFPPIIAGRSVARDNATDMEDNKKGNKDDVT